MPFNSFYPSRSRVADQFGDLFSPSGETPSYQSDNFARNAFSVPRITASDYQTPESEPNDYFSQMRKLYDQPSPSMDEYRSFLKTSPNPEDYRPNKWTRLAAGLSGIAAGFKDPGKGILTAMTVNRQPFQTALEDYKARAGPLQEAAKLESEDQDSMLKYYQQAAQLANTHQANLNTRNRDIETAAWHNRTAGETAAHNKWLETSGDKRLNNETRNINSLMDYRTKGLGIQGFSAETARQGMLNTDKNARDRNAIDLYGKMNPPKHQFAPTSPQDFHVAQQDVMATMAPTYPDLIDHDPTTGALSLKPPPPVGTKEYFRYQAGMQELQRRIKQRAAGGLGFGGDGGGGGSRYEDLGSGEEEQ